MDPSGVTWNNQPALGATAGGGFLVGTAARYYEWDLSSFVSSQKAAPRR